MKPGDFVVLVNDRWDSQRRDRLLGVQYPVRGPVYTVRDALPSLTRNGEISIRLVEIVNPVLPYKFGRRRFVEERMFFAHRFRVLDPKALDVFQRELETT